MSQQPIMTKLGYGLNVVISLLFIMSAFMKLSMSPDIIKGFEHLQLPQHLILPIGILELTCVLIYLIPWTSMLGAILLTGYLGGAILTHVRIGESIAMHIVLGVVIWFSIFMREPYLRRLIPFMLDSHKPPAKPPVL
jgi:hypothetical protein